ncbi:MAG: chromosomal replication initiator protein DnaA [Eubacterium sp.]|nr:chromosomal replication initiator protein DnaA [Eubacterium sp.]MBR1675196.1 chromosomal replication initiator protein DnaA [Eubacterium sp.]
MEELIKEKWNDILRILETDYDVSKIIIDTWIRTLEIFKVEDNTIYFYVDEKRGKHGVEYLHKKGYDIFLLSAIREIFNDSDINIIIDEKNNYIPHNETGIDGIEQKLHREYSEGYYNAVKRSNLNPKYTFENFIVGDSNRHAYATCLAVADLPCQDNFNPLFIYGGSGLGKTHLMQSIAHYILQNDENTNVLYTTSEIFTNDIIDAIQKNKTDDFRDKYRRVDVLLIDDIQEIIGRERTQQEFFNTFNYLYEAKKQIIISSDKPPKEIKSLEERLRSRFEWGVPIDIHAPDYETRMAILRNKAELNGLTGIPDGVFNYIAENIVSNVRELEGALNKISVYAKLMNVNITEDLARDTLKDLISKETTSVVITPELILSTVAEHMDISTEDIKSKKRSADIAIARQLVMYLCRNLTDRSLQSIGDTVGGKDHATVYNGIKRIEEKVKEDSQFNSTVDIIIKKLNPQE